MTFKLTGYKCYIVCGLYAIYALIGYSLDQLTGAEAGEVFFQSGIGATLRNGVKQLQNGS
jgi:hypothetical protein